MRHEGCLEFELVRPERLSEPFPGGLDELGAAHDLLKLGPGGVAAHVLFPEHLLERGVLVYTLDDVLEDLLLTGLKP